MVTLGKLVFVIASEVELISTKRGNLKCFKRLPRHYVSRNNTRIFTLTIEKVGE
mgnify:CR=1